MKKITIYDTTLRDGAQSEGINFSLPTKLRLARSMDEFGIDYIEGGFAASNPKDMAFFEEMKKQPLRNAKLAAFGSTRRANIAPRTTRPGRDFADARRWPRWQELAAARGAGAQDHAGRKPQDDCRLGALSEGEGARGGL